jgi:hypothetical protein
MVASPLCRSINRGAATDTAYADEVVDLASRDPRRDAQAKSKIRDQTGQMLRTACTRIGPAIAIAVATAIYDA